jgi:RNA polymerase sigma-70 factor, ECF subfamily
MTDVRSGPEIAQIVAEHHRAVYGYAYRLTGSVHDAEDLTQEVFLIAHRKIGQLRDVETAKSWLFAIARNAFLRDRRPKHPLLAADADVEVDLIADDPADDGVDRDRLQAALNRLPEVFRAAVAMYYFEERSYREIADELDVPIGTVMSRLARAKDQLRLLLLEAEQTRKTMPSSKAAE